MSSLRLKGKRMVCDDPPDLQFLEAYGRSMPVCGDIVRRLLRADPEMRISQDLLEVLQGVKKSQTEALSILTGLPERDEAGDEGLRPYQEVGARWMAFVRRCILCDEVGGGKTVTSLSAAKRVMPKSAVVVCPIAKIRDWEDHIEKWSPPKEIWKVTNLQQIHKLKTPELVIIDEAHKIRNRKTALFKDARSFVRGAKYIFLLTASPTINESMDAWALLHLCDPLRFGSYWGMAFRFFHIEQEYMGMKVGGIKDDEKEDFKKILSPYLLRRTDLLDLPTPAWETIDYTLTGEQEALYESMRKKNEAEYNGEEIMALTPLSKITRLRQLALHPGLIFPGYFGPSKLDALPGVIAKWEGQVLVFSQYASLVRISSEFLNNLEISTMYVDSTKSLRVKMEDIDKFKAGKAKVLCLTYKIGGEGLNLENASLGIMLDLPWHPEGLRQAMGRILRSGQLSEEVGFKYIHAGGTIDDRIREIVISKKRVTIKEIMTLIKER